jgi:competence protein ComEA
MRVRVFSKDQQVIVLVLGLTILFVGLFRPFHPFGSILGLSCSNLTNKPSHQSIIEVAGAVRNPGIYTFDESPTVYQAIQTTAGLINEHRLSSDTPGDTLETGMRIELQGANTECAQLIITPMSYRKRLVLGIPIEINQARIDDFAMIPGIGHALARRIVEFRESHSPFKTWNDLRRVNGIGPRKVEHIRSYLSLTQTSRNQK